MTIKSLGPYRIERTLGQGGMGTVYAAVNERTGQQAAIKVLSSLLAAKGSFRSRFESEIETLKRLQHPHIVQLFGYGEQEGHMFFAMELVDGRSLHDELKAGRQFTAEDVIRLGIEVASALKLAHDSGIIHRDLKPANLMLTSDGHIKLTDFGIAKLFGNSQLTAEGGIVGTVDFMSPEQAEGKPVTARSDLYSLGSVMYALLARRAPFTGRSLPQIIHALRFDAPAPLRRLAPDAPPELEAIVMQLLEKDPAQRIPTALILGNRLRALQHGLASRSDDPLADDGAASSDNPLGVSRANEATLASGVEDDPLGSAPAQFDLTWDSATNRPLPPIDRAQATQVDPLGVSAASSLGRFTTIAEEERRRVRQQAAEQRASWSYAWLQVGVGILAVIFLLIAGWQLMRPPSAESLYTAIDRVASEDDGKQLEDVRDEIDQFLTHYPDDPRATEVVAYRQRLDNEREQRRFARRTRRPGDGTSLSAVERLYGEAMQIANWQPDVAVERLQALLDAFGGIDSPDEPTKKTLELARHELERLTPIADRQHKDELELVKKRLDSADSLRAKDAKAAERIYRAIWTLYRDKSWAHEISSRAEKSLPPAARG